MSAPGAQSPVRVVVGEEGGPAGGGTHSRWCPRHSTSPALARGHLTSSLAPLGARSLSGTPPGGAAFGCPCAVLPTCAASWEHSLSGSEKLQGHPCGEPWGCAGHPWPWSVSREQEMLCPPRCPAPEIRHSPRSSPYLRDVGFFTLSLHANFLSEPSRHCIAIETELVKIPCSLLIIEFQRQAKRFFQGLELRLRGGGEQPTRTGRLWELAGLLPDSQSRAQAPGKGPGQAHSDLAVRP